MLLKHLVPVLPMPLITAETHLSSHSSRVQKLQSSLSEHLTIYFNSQNPCAKGFKAALRKSNKSSWKPFLDEAREYIIGLENTLGKPMYTSRRKTGFIGFLVEIDSIQSIFSDLVEKEAPMNYILTYKFSQDHLELFFGAIRSSGGFNNNPTVQQFTAAYKRLLLRSSVEGCNGNCTKQDETDILEVIGDSYKAKNMKSNITTMKLLSYENMTYKG